MRLIAWLMTSSHTTVTSGTQSSARTYTSIKRQTEVEHRHAVASEHHAGDDGADDLGRRRDLADVVEQADDEDDASPRSAHRAVPSCREQIVEAVHQPTDGERDHEPDEHRDATDVGRGHLVHAAFVGRDDPARA